jgi:hypothetical protein
VKVLADVFVPASGQWVAQHLTAAKLQTAAARYVQLIGQKLMAHHAETASIAVLCWLLLAGRYLTAMPIDEATQDFITWGIYQQVDTLTNMDLHTAAALLTRVPEALRKELLGMMDAHVAANIVQVGSKANKKMRRTKQLSISSKALPLHKPNKGGTD